MRKLNTDTFIEKVRIIHGAKYDYGKVIYVDAHTKIIIICPEHGEFMKTPNKHMSGQGCPACTGLKRLSTNDFIEKSIKVHGDKYDYSKSVVQTSKSNVVITCPEHGDFKQLPSNHTRGAGCPSCSRIRITDKRRLTSEQFEERAKMVHGDKYIYKKVEYLNTGSDVVITCSEHGDFTQTPENHLQGKGCPSCACSGPSLMERQLYDYVKSLVSNTGHSVRNLISPLELDIVCYDQKIAIEFNGRYWHNDQHKDRKYHLDKRKLCESVGYRLISVWEDEWLTRRTQVENIIKNALGVVHGEKVNARQCHFETPSPSEYRQFMNANHIQGYSAAAHKFSLVHPGKGVVAMMSVKNTKNGWDLVRYATTCNVRGGLSKLLKHVTDSLNINEISSFVDYDYFTGSAYEAVGFVKVGETISFSCWNRHLGKHHRSKWTISNIQKTLRSMGVTLSIEDKTQNQIMDESNTLRFWNSGTGKLVWQRK